MSYWSCFINSSLSMPHWYFLILAASFWLPHFDCQLWASQLSEETSNGPPNWHPLWLLTHDTMATHKTVQVNSPPIKSLSLYIYICNVEVCLHTVTFNTSSQIFEGGWFPCARRTAARILQFITTFIAHGAYSVACNLVQSIDCIPTASTCMNNSHSNWNWRNCDVKRSFIFCQFLQGFAS